MFDIVSSYFNDYIYFYQRNGFAVFSLIFALIYAWHITLRTAELVLKVLRYRRGENECDHGQN